LFEYFKWDFLDVYNVFLQKYNFADEDKNFSFMNDDTIHIPVTKEKFYRYCQYKKLNITQERIEQKFNDDVITSVSIDWRSFARNILRTTFTPSDLKALNLTRTDVSKYNGNMQHDLMDLVKKGMLNTSTAI
jgi:hypothetical protein